jgi:hypothetical protein
MLRKDTTTRRTEKVAMKKVNLPTFDLGGG